MIKSSLLLTAMLCCLPAQTKAAQNELARSVVLNQSVEFTAALPSDEADFRTVSVRLGGKLLKQFAATRGGFLAVVATFDGYDGDYLLLRTSMGQGACAGGDLYALKFYTVGEQRVDQVAVEISPVLTTCLGESPPVKFDYDSKGELVISVSGYELKGDPWTRWTPERKVKAQKRRS